MRCRIPTYTGVVLTAQRGAPYLFMARYDTHTLLWRVRGAHKELGRSCLLVLDCSGAWRDIGSYVRCAVLPMRFVGFVVVTGCLPESVIPERSKGVQCFRVTREELRFEVTVDVKDVVLV